MKKRKFNILLNIAVLCMCVCAIAIGVYSAKTASLNVSGTIGFTAHNCKVRVLGKITGAVNASNVALDPATTPALNYYDSIDNTKGKLIDGTADSWNFDKIYFDDLNAEGDAIATDIVFTFTLTNESTAYDVIATLNVDNLPSNVKPAVTFSTGSNNSGFVCELKKDKTAVTMTLTLSLLTSENISDATKNLDLTLSFDRVNQNQTIEALGYTFNNGTILGLPSTTETNATLNIPSYFYNTTNGVIFTKELYNGDGPNVSALDNLDKYSKLIIPNSVTSIGEMAFTYCSNLISIYIPNSVTSIGESAFSGCSGLTSITIPNSITSISLTNCDSLTSITIPNGVTSINISSNGLTSITIPNGITSLNLSGCKKLTSITIPDSVTSIGEYAFSSCSGLTSITIPDSVTSIRQYAFSGCSGLTSITIPDSVTSIGQSAFSSCSGLTSVILPNRITSLEPMMFENCEKLISITIPNSVTLMSSEIFRGCTNLKSVIFEKTDNWQYSTDYGRTYTDLSEDMSLTNPADNSTKFKGAWKNYYFRQKTAN